MIIVKRLDNTTEYFNTQFIKSMLYNQKTNILEIYDQDDNSTLIMPNSKFNPIVLETSDYKNIIIEERN